MEATMITSGLVSIGDLRESERQASERPSSPAGATHEAARRQRSERQNHANVAGQVQRLVRRRIHCSLNQFPGGFGNCHLKSVISKKPYRPRCSRPIVGTQRGASLYEK